LRLPSPINCTYLLNGWNNSKPIHSLSCLSSSRLWLEDSHFQHHPRLAPHATSLLGPAIEFRAFETFSPTSPNVILDGANGLAIAAEVIGWLSFVSVVFWFNATGAPKTIEKPGQPRQNANFADITLRWQRQNLVE
jgi:hypothetical protein